MGKLWQKGEPLAQLVETFTVGNDYLMDDNLVSADVLGSIAHAKTLLKANILSSEEYLKLEKSLKEILKLHKENSFTITVGDEDCHTAIENYLVKNVGEAGKKIHTGRSRNDQVQTALRLWMREFNIQFALEVLQFVKTLFNFAKENEEIPMPGRTHMQLAMPSSVGLWAASFGEELLDLANHLLSLNAVLDQSPLGSAASYGTKLPLDREFSAKEMGFNRVQNNVLYANNSRGKFEAMLLDGCDYVMLTLSKIAQDLLIFTLGELNYFSLPAYLCTGSSIMPQKKNPDLLELIRSRSAVVSSCCIRVKEIIRSLPSGYNRDFQDTKEPLFSGCKSALLSLRVMNLAFENLTVNEKALTAGFKSEIYATDEVFNRLGENIPFRELYLDVGKNLQKVGKYDPYEAVKNRSSVGTSGNLRLELKLNEAKERETSLREKQRIVFATYKTLADWEDSVIRW